MSTNIEARIDAVADLITAHIITMDRQLPGSAQATIQQAEAMRACAADDGQASEAKALLALLDALRFSLDLPIND